jgi:hypothetical protein
LELYNGRGRSRESGTTCKRGGEDNSFEGCTASIEILRRKIRMGVANKREKKEFEIKI